MQLIGLRKVQDIIAEVHHQQVGESAHEILVQLELVLEGLRSLVTLLEDGILDSDAELSVVHEEVNGSRCKYALFVIASELRLEGEQAL